MIDYENIEPGYYWAKDKHSMGEYRNDIIPVEVTYDEPTKYSPGIFTVYVLGWECGSSLESFEFIKELKYEL